MKFFRTHTALFLLIFGLGFFAERAYACSCAPNGTVDQELARAGNVVILKVRSIEKTEKEPPRLVNYGGILQTTLTVEKVFKGKLKVGEELILKQGGGADCVWTFGPEDVGQEFLFYLGAGPLDKKASEGMIAGTGQFPIQVKDNVWIAWTCSRSGNVKYRANDLSYLENASKVRGKTRLSGQVSQYVDSATEDVAPRYELLSDHKILISGNGKNIELKTDKNGSYEIYDLPPGKYKLTPQKVDGYKFNDSPNAFVDVTLNAKGHEENDFRFGIDNAIRGKFYDANGKTLYEVCLELVPVNGKTRQYFHEFDCTEKDGSWEIEDVPAGQYVIMVNDDNEISARQPFATFYYPSAKRREDAEVISIGPGEVRENLVIKAPETRDVVAISGVLRYEDGKPVPKESVNFFEASRAAERKPKDNMEEDSRVTTDALGQFELRVLKGQKGIVFGSMYTFSGEYLNCPKLERLIRVSGSSVPEIESPSLTIDASQNISGVELRFPFPSCKKAKIE